MNNSLQNLDIILTGNAHLWIFTFKRSRCMEDISTSFSGIEVAGSKFIFKLCDLVHILIKSNFTNLKVF